MQISHQQEETHDQDAVLSWQSLMQKWDAAYARYRAAMEAGAMIEAPPGRADERKTGEAEALAELTKIKQQIDRLIVESGSRRQPIVDSIVVGTIETGGLNSDRAANVASASRLDAPEPGPKSPWPALVDWILQRCSVALKKAQNAKDDDPRQNRDKQN